MALLGASTVPILTVAAVVLIAMEQRAFGGGVLVAVGGPVVMRIVPAAVAGSDGS